LVSREAFVLAEVDRFYREGTLVRPLTSSLRILRSGRGSCKSVDRVQRCQCKPKKHIEHV